MPIVESTFRPTWFAPGGHAQTLWAPLMRRRLRVDLRRERMELPDGDFVDLEWLDPDREGALVVMLHGLQGSSRSPYIRGMMRALARAGHGGVLMHFRGCGGEPNRLPRAYHSGETGDLAHLVERLAHDFPGRAIACIGYSLGANVLLKWLGETGRGNPLAAAVGVSPPFDLGRCCDALTRGFSRVYHNHLLASLKRSVFEKSRVRGMALPLDGRALADLRTLRDFDERVTAPLHGFAGAEDYYTRSSCRLFLRHIAVPTLIVHALDDPFTPSATVPGADELSPSVRLELSRGGGHVGFVGGSRPWRADFWLESRIPGFLGELFGTPCAGG